MRVVEDTYDMLLSLATNVFHYSLYIMCMYFKIDYYYYTKYEHQREKNKQENNQFSVCLILES